MHRWRSYTKVINVSQGARDQCHAMDMEIARLRSSEILEYVHVMMGFRRLRVRHYVRVIVGLVALDDLSLVCAATPVPTPSPSASATPSSGPVLDRVEIAAVSVGGAVVGVAALGCVIIFRRRRARASEEAITEGAGAMLLRRSALPVPKSMRDRDFMLDSNDVCGVRAMRSARVTRPRCLVRR